MSIGGAGAWRPFPLRLRKERPSGESQEVLRLHLRRETVPSSCTQHDELENSLRARQLLGDQPRRAALAQNRERRRVVLWGLEESELRDEQCDIFEGRLLVFLDQRQSQRAAKRP